MSHDPLEEERAQVQQESDSPDVPDEQPDATTGDESESSDVAGIEEKAEQEESGEEDEYSIFSAPPERGGKVRGGSRLTRGLVFGLALLVVLGGGAFAFTRLLPQPVPASSSAASSDPALVFINEDVANATKVVVTNAAGGFTLTLGPNQGNTGSSSSSSDSTSSDVWNPQSWPKGAVLDPAKTSGVPSALSSITATKEMSATQSDSPLYGLDKPTATGTITFKDGKSYTLTLGKRAPDQSGYYATFTGKPGIYLVATNLSDSLSSTPESFAGLGIVSAPVATGANDTYFSNGTLTHVDGIQLSGANWASGVKVTYEDSKQGFSNYMITSPINAVADSISGQNSIGKIGTILSPFTSGVNAESILAFQPTAADLAKYGLDKPRCVVSYTLRGKTTTLRIGNAGGDSSSSSSAGTSSDTFTSSSCAVMVDGNPSIFSVSASTFGFLSWHLNDIREHRVYIADITGVGSITLSGPGKPTYNFTLIQPPAGSSSDSTSSVELVVKENGKTVDLDSFRKLYQWFIATSALEFADGQTPSGQPTCTLTFTKTQAGGSDVIQFTTASDMRDMVTVNGKNPVLVTPSVKEKWFQYAQDLLDGKTVAAP